MIIAKKKDLLFFPKKYLVHTVQKVNANLNVNIALNSNTIQECSNIENRDYPNTILEG